MTTLDEFRALAVPTAPDGFRVGRALVPGCFLCKTAKSQLGVLVRAERTGRSAPRRLSRVHYDPPRLLCVLDERGERTESLASLVCCAQEPALQEMFLEVAVLLLRGPETRSEDELEARIDELIELLEALARPGTKTVQGLWAELALIAWSADPVAAVSSWHSKPGAVHDFESNLDNLEVKSAVTGLREHAMSLDQLAELPGGRTLIASFVLEESDEGASVPELVGTICMRVGQNPEVARRVMAITMKTLGAEWAQVVDSRYSLAAAWEGLRFYEAMVVPAPARPTPVGVKQVRFVVDLTAVESTDVARARSMSPFFRALLPTASHGNAKPWELASARVKR